MDKYYIIQELNQINAARVNRMRVAELVLTSESNFLPLLQIVFNEHSKTAIKAAWVLEFVTHKKLNWLSQSSIENITKNGSIVILPF